MYHHSNCTKGQKNQKEKQDLKNVQKLEKGTEKELLYFTVDSNIFAKTLHAQLKIIQFG